MNNGWSQEQLAEISGLGIRTIQRIEREDKCSLESKMALASAFSLPPDELTQIETGANSPPEGINWDGLIGLTIVFLVIGALGQISGNIDFYLDPWTLLLLLALPFGLSCISSGTKITLRVYSSLTWLLYMPGGNKSVIELIPTIRRIIFYVYISGVIGTLVSLIAIFSNLTFHHTDFWPAMAISLISLLYSVIIAESLLRPLKHKYEQMLAH